VGDRCWLEVNLRESDLNRLGRIFGAPPFDEIDESESHVTGFIGEINYGGLREREEMAQAKIPFHGSHGAGGEYPECVFASFDGKMTAVPSIERMPVITVNEEDLNPVEGVGPPTRHVSDQVARIRRYYDLLKKVNAAFDEDLPVTTV